MSPETKTVLQNTARYVQQSRTYGDTSFLQPDHDHALLLESSHSDGLYTEQSHFHQHKRSFSRDEHSVPEDEGKLSFLYCFVPGNRIAFFSGDPDSSQVIPDAVTGHSKMPGPFRLRQVIICFHMIAQRFQI